MRLIKFFSVFIAIPLISVTCLAGGWIISGGEIFRNEKNPWFVKNTTEVHYCVQFATTDFSIAQDQVVPMIAESLSYWKSELNGASAISLGAPLPGLANESLQVADQKFLLNGTCLGNEELVFKFGAATLDENEVKKMESPAKYVGVTIRKTYDEKELRGTGMIYISGDVGKNAYAKTSKDVIDQAWQYPKLLHYVILHELGHVFGIPHSGSGLMSEVFLDQLLIRKFAALYVREPISSFIKPPAIAEICDASLLPTGTQNFLAPYFSLVFQEDCLKLELAENKKEYTILTKKTAADSTAWKKLGTLVIDRNELVDYSLKPAVVLQLPETQTVFKPLDTIFLIGPVYQNYKVDGHITFGTSQKSYTVQVDISPDSIVVYGLFENRIRQIFSFGNPLLFSLIKPF